MLLNSNKEITNKTVFRNGYSFFCPLKNAFWNILVSSTYIEERGVVIGYEKSDIRILSGNIERCMGEM